MQAYKGRIWCVRQSDLAALLLLAAEEVDSLTSEGYSLQDPMFYRVFRADDTWTWEAQLSAWRKEDHTKESKNGAFCDPLMQDTDPVNP